MTNESWNSWPEAESVFDDGAGTSLGVVDWTATDVDAALALEFTEIPALEVDAIIGVVEMTAIGV